MNDPLVTTIGGTVPCDFHGEEMLAALIIQAKQEAAKRILELANEHCYRGGLSLFEDAVSQEFGLKNL